MGFGKNLLYWRYLKWDGGDRWRAILGMDVTLDFLDKFWEIYEGRGTGFYGLRGNEDMKRFINRFEILL